MMTASLYSIRVYSLMKINNTPLKLEYLETSLNRIIDPSFPLILDRQAVMTAFFVAIFVFALINTYLGSYKRTVQEQTYGTSEWGDAMDLNKMKAKNLSGQCDYHKHRTVCQRCNYQQYKQTYFCLRATRNRKNESVFISKYPFCYRFDSYN